MDETESAVSKQCPLFLHEEYDLTFPNAAWSIGLKSTYPDELLQRIAAAFISLQAGNRSIDYTLKRYVKGKYNTNDGSRLDLRIDEVVRRKMAGLSDLIFQVTCRESKHQGQVLCEWTYLRIPFSIGMLLSCGHRGALFESVALARMILEQIAWACKVDAMDDVSSIQRTSASKAIGDLGKYSPASKRLYGWLSKHAHWAYEGHVKAMYYEDKHLATMLASSAFKAKVLALALLLSIIAIGTFCALKQERVNLVLDSPQDKIAARPRLDQPRVSVFDSLFPHPPPKLAALLEVKNCDALLALLDELQELASSDSDIATLSKLARAKVS